MGWAAVPRTEGDAIANGPYPNASKAERPKVYVWARNVNPVVETVQDVQLGFHRRLVWLDEDRMFSLGLGWDWSSGRQRRGTRRRRRRGGRLIQGERLIITGCSLWTGNGSTFSGYGSDDAMRSGSIALLVRH